MADEIKPDRTMFGLDGVDRAIVETLSLEARISNKALAERVGVAPSTCLVRTRALEDAGVLRGYHADVDQRRLGRAVEVLLTVRVGADADPDALLDGLAALPEVLVAYGLAEGAGVVAHVASASPAALRRTVAREVAGRAGVTGVQAARVTRRVCG